MKTRLIGLRKKYLDVDGAVTSPPAAKKFAKVSSPVKGAFIRREIKKKARKAFWKKLEKFRRKQWKTVGKWVLELDDLKEAQRLDHSNRKAPASAFKADADAQKSRRAHRREAHRASLALTGEALKRSSDAGTRAAKALAHQAKCGAIREQLDALRMHVALCQQLDLPVDDSVPGDLKDLYTRLKKVIDERWEDNEGAGQAGG